MSSRDNALWQECWRNKETDFHQKAVNPLLIRYWPSLRLPTGSRVFVPLCGKSLDILWLAEQGHDVIAVELSPVAVRSFFRENRLQAKRSQIGPFTLWENGRLHILCGDYFALSNKELGDIDAVYDRAALTALPEDIRPDYVAKLHSLLPAHCPTLLLTTEDMEDGESEADAQIASIEISTLYASRFKVAMLHVHGELEEITDDAPIRIQLKAYQLTTK